MIRKMMGEELIKELSSNKSAGSSKDAVNLIDIDMSPGLPTTPVVLERQERSGGDSDPKVADLLVADGDRQDFGDGVINGNGSINRTTASSKRVNLLDDDSCEQSNIL